jgi:hypothetical protein
MADVRLNSVHLEFPRRQVYRQSREALLEARGVFTRAGEGAMEWFPGLEDWKSWLPGCLARVVPGTPFVLIDRVTGATYPLATGLNTLGRYASNDIVLEGSGISRRHGVILVHARGGCELFDTASRNGVFVNGQRVVGTVKLQSGDLIQLSRRQFYFVSVEDCQDSAIEEGEITRAD